MKGDTAPSDLWVLYVIIGMAIGMFLVFGVFDLVFAKNSDFTVISKEYYTDFPEYKKLDLKYKNKVSVFKDSYGEVFFAVDCLGNCDAKND